MNDSETQRGLASPTPLKPLRGSIGVRCLPRMRAVVLAIEDKNTVQNRREWKPSDPNMHIDNVDLHTDL